MCALINSAALVGLRWAELNSHWNHATLRISLPSLVFWGLGVQDLMGCGQTIFILPMGKLLNSMTL